MRCGMNSLPIKVQAGLGRDPFGGELFCYRGRKADQVKILWHDGVGMSLYVKRLEAGKFIWPTPGAGEALAISAAQLGYLLAGIDWRNPRWTRAAVKDGIIARKHLPEAARPPVSQMIAFIEESREALGGPRVRKLIRGINFPDGRQSAGRCSLPLPLIMNGALLRAILSGGQRVPSPMPP